MNPTPVVVGHFPESNFPPREVFRGEYWQQVAAGYRRMRRTRIVLAGLARDVDWVLRWTMARMIYTGERFADYQVVIYENDSRDQTLPMLRAWQASDSKVHVLSETRTDPINPIARCGSRAKRMAYYRTQCQQYIREHLSDLDYVMIVDTDLLGGWSYDGIAQTFSRTDWDFVGANGIIFRRRGWKPNETVQYDAWAYRNDENFTPWSTREVNRLRFMRGEPWHPVTSCFGGVGIYAMKAYLAGSYAGEDLEHTNLHRSMRQAGFLRTYLNPSLLAVYGRKRRKMDQTIRRIHEAIQVVPGLPVVRWEFDPVGMTDSLGGWDLPRAA